MRQAVPLRAVLQMHDHQIITDHIGTQRVIAPQLVVHVGFTVAHRRAQDGSTAPGVEHTAAWKIQGQTQVERDAMLDLGHALHDFVRGQ